MLSLLPQLLVSGIAIGMLYALIGLSMTILYRATTVVNFGHGDLVMAGAYMVLIFTIHVSLPFIPALLLSLAALFGFGYLLHRAFIWPIITGPHLSLAMMAIAIGYAVRGLVRLEYGSEMAKMPRPFEEQFFFAYNTVMTLDEITFCVVVVVMLIVSYFVFSKTRFGRIVQAMFQTQRGAALVGINVRLYNNLIWGVGCALGALGGGHARPHPGARPGRGGVDPAPRIRGHDPRRVRLAVRRGHRRPHHRRAREGARHLRLHRVHRHHVLSGDHRGAPRPAARALRPARDPAHLRRAREPRLIVSGKRAGPIIR